MSTDLFASPTAFTLNPYDGSGVNDPSEPVNLHSITYQNKVVVAVFLRIDASAAGGDSVAGAWMAAVRRIHNSNTGVQGLIVVYDYVGSAYTPLISSDIVGDAFATQNHETTGLPLRDSDFAEIPILFDASDPVGPLSDYASKVYRDGGIINAPGFNLFDQTDDEEKVPHQCAIYILQPWDWTTPATQGYHRITDKWHTRSLENALYPLHLRHLRSRVPTDLANHTGNPEIIDDYIIDRAANLLGSLSVIRTYPSDQTMVNDLTDIDVVYSKPPDAATLTYTLSGNGVETPIPGHTDVSTSQDDAENVVSLRYTGLNLLDDLTQDDTATLTISGDVTFDSEWTVALTCPATIAGDSHQYRTSSPYTLDVTFPYPVDDITDQAVIDGFVTGGSVSEVELAPNPSLDADDRCAAFTLTITPDPATTVAQDGNDITILIPADITLDAAGNDNLVSGETTVTFDNNRPAPVITLATGVTPPVPSSFDITVDFGEPVLVPLSDDYDDWFDDSDTDDCSVGSIGPNPVGTVGDYRRYFTATVTPPVSPTGSTVNINLNENLARDPAGNLNEEATLAVEYTAALPQGERRIAVVVDISGSMGSDVSVNAQPEQPKLDYVEEALDAFLGELQQSVFEGNLDENDEIRFYTYSSSPHSVNPPGPAWLRLSDLTDTSIDQVTASLVSGGSTAMGDALTMALADLRYLQNPDPDGFERHLVLFADGQNNHGSSISQSGVGNPVTINAATPIGINHAAGWEIPIHTIGIMTSGHGDVSPWLQTLEVLSVASAPADGAVHHAMTDDTVWDQTNAALTSVIEKIYLGNTPQEVFSVTDAIPAGSMESSYSFTLDASHKTALILATWTGSEALDVELSRGQMTVQSTRPARQGRKNIIRTYRFPMLKPRPKPPAFRRLFRIPGHALPYLVVPAAGEWTVTVRRKSKKAEAEARFYLSVLGDGKGIAYSLSIPNRRILAGEPIDATFLVKVNGISSSGNLAGLLGVEHRKYAASDVLAKYARHLPQTTALIRQITPSISSGKKLPLSAVQGESTPTESRWRQLKDLKQASSLLGRRIASVLKARGGFRPGGLSWRIADTTTPGIYSLRFLIEGEDPKIGRFQRTVSRSVTVHPKIDTLSSGIEVKVPSPGLLKLVFTPRSAAGHLLGPGWSDSLDIRCKALKKGTIEDRLDGSYSMDLAFESRYGTDTPIVVMMAGQRLVRGTLGRLGL